jgi:hypothetical protein
MKSAVECLAFTTAYGLCCLFGMLWIIVNIIDNFKNK